MAMSVPVSPVCVESQDFNKGICLFVCLLSTSIEMEGERKVTFQKPLKPDMGVHRRLSAFPAGKGFANSATHRALAGKV